MWGKAGTSTGVRKGASSVIVNSVEAELAKDDIATMRADEIPAEELGQLTCAARLGVRRKASGTSEPSQQALGRAKAFAQTFHVEVAVALGEAASVGGHQKRHVGIGGLWVAKQTL